MKTLTTKQVVIRILVIMSLVELIIMLAFGVLGYEKHSIYIQAGTDILVLVVFSTPLIYKLVITPFVKARDQALEQLNYLAQTDPLTRLPNRRSIFTELEKFIASTVRHKYYGAVLLLDLDGFKEINDEYGHAAGDEVLTVVAERLRSRVRVDEVIGRLGGDEFVLLINNLDAQEQAARDKVINIGEQLVALISKPIAYRNVQLFIGVSIGIRLFGVSEIDTEVAIKDADTAMYRAKQSGKGRCHVFEEL